jgi:nucleoside-diphosphate-sugar epimerase
MDAFELHRRSTVQLMRILVTGGGGVLGRAAIPLLHGEGHDVFAPARADLDLFAADAVTAAVKGSDAVLHLATRIPPQNPSEHPEAWRDNDRLRTEALRLLVEAALRSDVGILVQPTVTFVYPDGTVDEDTPIGAVAAHLESALVAERETLRFAAAGRTGVVLRLGLLDGPGTRCEERNDIYGATLHVDDAGAALVAALEVPTGIYNVCRDGERVSNARFKQASGWRPLH